ncbi:MAG: acyl-CoA desaturase, partial [bacterium]|nr:acyl-CoA desaturase [bacterium]
IAGIGRMVVNHHTTFCINSVCHYLGRRPYSDKHSARDSWISSLLTYGEGYHNFHHTFQYDYRNGIRFFHWDPTKWLIRFFQWTGLAQGLKKAREEKILLALVEMDSKRLALALAKKPPLLRQRFEEMVASTQIRVQESLIRFHQMKERLQEMKKDRLATWNHSMEEAREEYRLAKMEFQIALLQWRALVNGPLLA